MFDIKFIYDLNFFNVVSGYIYVCSKDLSSKGV